MVHNESFAVSEHERLVLKPATVSPRSIDSESVARDNVGGTSIDTNNEPYF